MIYWAYPVYGIGSIRFFPDWFYSALHLDQRLADGMALHFVLMWLFVLHGVSWCHGPPGLSVMHGTFYCTISALKKNYRPRKNTTLPSRSHIQR